jgi:hypothetical protein
MDIAIDPLTGDILLTAAGDYEVIEGRDAIAQHVRIRLQHFLGEWFLDEREGVPYFERILVANPDLVAIREAYRRTIAETPGIASVRDIGLDFDRQTRTLRVTGSAVTTDGATITAEEFAVPFVATTRSDVDEVPALT